MLNHICLIVIIILLIILMFVILTKQFKKIGGYNIKEMIERQTKNFTNTNKTPLWYLLNNPHFKSSHNKKKFLMYCANYLNAVMKKCGLIYEEHWENEEIKNILKSKLSEFKQETFLPCVNYLYRIPCFYNGSIFNYIDEDALADSEVGATLSRLRDVMTSSNFIKIIDNAFDNAIYPTVRNQKLYIPKMLFSKHIRLINMTKMELPYSKAPQNFKHFYLQYYSKLHQYLNLNMLDLETLDDEHIKNIINEHCIDTKQKYFITSDLHGKFNELIRFLTYANRLINPIITDEFIIFDILYETNIIFLGDIITYKDPIYTYTSTHGDFLNYPLVCMLQILKLVKNKDDIYIAGNHDKGLLTRSFTRYIGKSHPKWYDDLKQLSLKDLLVYLRDNNDKILNDFRKIVEYIKTNDFIDITPEEHITKRFYHLFEECDFKDYQMIETPDLTIYLSHYPYYNYLLTSLNQKEDFTTKLRSRYELPTDFLNYDIEHFNDALMLSNEIIKNNSEFRNQAACLYLYRMKNMKKKTINIHGHIGTFMNTNNMTATNLGQQFFNVVYNHTDKPFIINDNMTIDEIIDTFYMMSSYNEVLEHHITPEDRQTAFNNFINYDEYRYFNFSLDATYEDDLSGKEFTVIGSLAILTFDKDFKNPNYIFRFNKV